MKPGQVAYCTILNSLLFYAPLCVALLTTPSGGR